MIFESVAICQYLLDRHPDSGLMPAVDSVRRGHFYQWLMYLNNSLQAETMLYFYPYKYASQTHLLSLIKAMAEERVTKIFQLLDTQLQQKSYLIGEQLSLCDILLFMVAHRATEFKQPPLAMLNLSRYLKQLAKHPAIERTYIKEGKSLTLYHQ